MTAPSPVKGTGAWPAGLALLLLAIVAYLPALDAGWVIDDANYVTENSLLSEPGGLRAIWLAPSRSPQYYPLVFTSFWIEHALWGLRPFGYHAVNVLLHALNVLLVWFGLRRLSLRGAWLAAALFAVHPIHVESVVWVAERKNLLSGLFFLLSILSYLRFAEWGRGDAARGSESNTDREWRFYALSLICCAAALLAKTAAAVLPGAILLLIWWRRGRLRPRDFALVSPMILLGAALALFTVRIEQGLLSQGEEFVLLNGGERVLLMSRAAWFYVGKILWPAGLCFDYGLWSLRPISPLYLAPLVLLLVVLGLLWYRRQRWGRGPLSAAFFYLGVALPALGIVPLFFHRYAYVADHFVYLPSLGLLVPAAALIVRGLGRLPRSARSPGSAALASLLLIMAVLTWQRARAFENLVTLARHTLACNEQSWLAHNNLGNEYLRRGELAASLGHLREADAIAPDRVETQANLAIVLMNLGEYAQAEACARRVAALKPGNALGFRLLGENFLRAGKVAEAARTFAEACERDPGDRRARRGLGIALAQSGRYSEAVDILEVAVAEDPTNLPARTSLAYALAGLGRREEAIAHLEAALAVDPANASLRSNLARLRGESSP